MALLGTWDGRHCVHHPRDGVTAESGGAGCSLNPGRSAHTLIPPPTYLSIPRLSAHPLLSPLLPSTPPCACPAFGGVSSVPTWRRSGLGREVRSRTGPDTAAGPPLGRWLLPNWRTLSLMTLNPPALMPLLRPFPSWEPLPLPSGEPRGPRESGRIGQTQGLGPSLTGWASELCWGPGLGGPGCRRPKLSPDRLQCAGVEMPQEHARLSTTYSI